MLLWLLVFVSHIEESCQGSSLRRLYRELLRDYNPQERPVGNDSTPLTVTFSISILQILDVDERNQVVSTNLWLRMNWKDHYLRWNESEYPGVKTVRFPTDQIWIPDILLYNSASDRFDSTFKTNVLVNSSGDCTYISPGIFLSSCRIDVRWFPFDVQKCRLKFGSWSYDGWQLDLQMLEADLSGFIPNGEWDLIGVPGHRNQIYYACCNSPFTDITFSITVRRRTLYYTLNLLIPCGLLSSMALLVFLLPAQSGEKLSLSITVLLSLTVFMLLMADIIPATSDSIPLIGQYFVSTMIIVGLSIITTVFILQYHYHSPPEGALPTWVQVVLLHWCAWFLRMKKPGSEASPAPCQLGPRRRSSEGERAQRQVPNGIPAYLAFRGLDQAQAPHPGPHKAVGGPDTGSNLPLPQAGWASQADPSQLGRILGEVAWLSQRLRDRDAAEMLGEDWRFAAAVLDRLCLVAFALLNIVCTISILMSAPNFIEAVSKDYL